MPKIFSYQKHIDELITRELLFPEGETRQRVGAELATIGAVTYVSLPDGVDLPSNQPAEIASSISSVVLTQALRNEIADASPFIRFVRQRVGQMIADRYSIEDEIKLLRTAPSPEFEQYNQFAEECRAWGREQKASVGL